MANSNDKPRYAYRVTPRVSANQMAEYLSSATSSTRRKSIIREARFPKTSVVAQYDRARDGLVNFLGDDTRSIKHFAKAADYLDKRAAATDASAWIKRDCRFSKEALEAFQNSYNKLPFGKLACVAVTGRLPLLDKWPTKISVALDVSVRKPVKDGKDRIGGALLLFSRGETSTKNRIERSKVIAGLIYTFCGTFMTELGDPDPSLCFAVDVFGGVAHQPPGSFAKKLRNVADACEEIADRWKTVEPPDDYDGPDPG